VLVSVNNLMIADLYGRSYLDVPEITYDASLYATQLALLMQHVKWPNAYVGGISMVCGRFTCCCCSHRLVRAILSKGVVFSSIHAAVAIIQSQSARLVPSPPPSPPPP
jgi:hypothetical protein